MSYRNFFIAAGMLLAAPVWFLAAQEGMQREEMPMERERPMMQREGMGGMMGMMGMMQECMRMCQEAREVSEGQIENLREARQSDDPEVLRSAIDQAIAGFERTGSHMERCMQMMHGDKEEEAPGMGMRRGTRE